MPTLRTADDLGSMMYGLAERWDRERVEVPPGVLDECVREAWSNFEDVPVRSFVPVLVERAVKARIGRLTEARDVPAAEVSPRTWAWLAAKRLLADELPRRWAHTWGVARRAQQIAPAFPPRERDVLVVAAWLHDVGYASTVAVTGFHQLDGARYLVGQGVPFRVCALVAHHAGAAAVADIKGLSGALAVFDDERSAVRDALWYCDMTTGPDGQHMTFDQRMAELRDRRSGDDPVIRALAVNGRDRAAAVERTEDRLRHAGRVPDRTFA
ncbi:hypothetical protein GCM10029964_062550 [Kibdelosporangium lantanae]